MQGRKKIPRAEGYDFQSAHHKNHLPFSGFGYNRTIVLLIRGFFKTIDRTGEKGLIYRRSGGFPLLQPTKRGAF